MLGFISQKQPTEKITDKESIDATYKYWRLHLMLSMYVGYGVFYFTRKASTLACRSC